MIARTLKNTWKHPAPGDLRVTQDGLIYVVVRLRSSYVMDVFSRNAIHFAARRVSLKDDILINEKNTT